MKRIKEILLFFLIGSAIVFMSGCIDGLGQYDLRKEEAVNLLKQKYGEDFDCHGIISEGEVYYASCSPVNSPEIVFETRISCGEINEDEYENTKKAKEMNDVFKKDLCVFFSISIL